MRINHHHRVVHFLVVCLTVGVVSVQGYLSSTPFVSRNDALQESALRTPRTWLEARRRGKSLDQELEAKSAANWLPLPDSLSPATSLPSQPDQLTFLDTQLPALTNAATNPTGAVAVVKHGSQTYCFASSCPSCKIPLAKARVAERRSSNAPDRTEVVLSCDFCKAAYDLSSGARVAELQSSGGLFSGVVSNLLKANPQSAGPLRTYKLGQVGGKLVIALD